MVCDFIRIIIVCLVVFYIICLEGVGGSLKSSPLKGTEQLVGVYVQSRYPVSLARGSLGIDLR